ncbi:hypothetical protein Tco_0183300, partial [Tanacetum coccineum]
KDSEDDKSQSDNEDESDSEHETDDNKSGSESYQEEDDEKIKDDEEENEEEEINKTPSNDSDDEDETKIADKVEGDENKEMDYTISLIYDDMDIRMNEPVDADKGFVQEEGIDAAITNVQQGNENLEISQVIEDAHVTLSTVLPKTEVPVSSSSRSSDLAAKFLNFSDIPPYGCRSLFQFNNRVTSLEHEVAELKKDPLHTQVTALVDEHLDAKLGVTRDEFMNFLSTSLIAKNAMSSQ